MLHTFPLKTTTLLVASALALASCARDEADIRPTPEGSYSRAVVYLDQAQPARHDTVYQSAHLQLSAKLNQGRCVIFLVNPTSLDEVGFDIPRAQMPATLVGRYPFYVPSQGARYSYLAQMPDKPAPASRDAWGYDSSWLPSTGAVSGAVDITAYDAQHHVLSGRFVLALTGVYDPRALSGQYKTRRCDLTLTGTFTNVPVTDGD
ncbi:MAG: hypothetical protein EOO60_05695 [Hymenobacter sp.]|nr:MAG: hypothetical protein EOO60_05695 [Hymenobacter sp.]